MSKFAVDPVAVKARCSNINSSIDSKLVALKNKYNNLNSGLSGNESETIDKLEELIKAHQKMVDSAISLLKNATVVIESMSDVIEQADGSLATKNKV